MDLSLKVKTDDSHYEVDITAGTLIACERQYKKPMPQLFASPSVEVLAWLAWEQTRKNGTTVPPFEKWIITLIDVDSGGDTAPLVEEA
jgi:hypothetical protein